MAKTGLNKTALITGASSGIGAALAKIHAKAGGDVILVARRADRLEALRDEIRSAHNVTVEVIAKDLTERAAAQAIYDEVSARGLTVDYLINNAGFGGQGAFHTRNWAEDLSMIELNIVALCALTQLFLPNLIARGEGRILNVSSTASLAPGPMQAVYGATKAFVTSFSNAIAEELRETGVTVTALMPGATESEFAQTAGMDGTPVFQRTATAESVAAAGYRGMLRGELDVITGLTFGQRMMVKALPITPKKTLLRQVRQMQSS